MRRNWMWDQEVGLVGVMLGVTIGVRNQTSLPVDLVRCMGDTFLSDNQ